MNTTDTALAGLITGDAGVDAKIRQAYAMGIEYAVSHPDKDQLIKSRVKLASRLIRTFRCTPEAALIAMDVPRKERKPVLKILQVQEQQRQAIKK